MWPVSVRDGTAKFHRCHICSQAVPPLMRRPSRSFAKEKGVHLDYSKLNSVGLLPTVDTLLEIQ